MQLVAAAGLGAGFSPRTSQEVMLHVWSAETGEEVGTRKASTGQVSVLAYSRDGSTVMTVDKSNIVSKLSKRTFAAEGHVGSFAITGHEQEVQSASLSTDGRTLVTSGLFDDLLIFWSVDDGSEIRRIEVPHSQGSNVAFAPNGKMVVSASAVMSTGEDKHDDAIHFWDVTTGHEIRAMEPGAASVSAIAFTPDGSHLLTGMSDGTLLVWPADAKDAFWPPIKLECPLSPSPSH
jgi:WD40 repeat protein